MFGWCGCDLEVGLIWFCFFGFYAILCLCLPRLGSVLLCSLLFFDCHRARNFSTELCMSLMNLKLSQMWKFFTCHPIHSGDLDTRTRTHTHTDTHRVTTTEFASNISLTLSDLYAFHPSIAPLSYHYFGKIHSFMAGFAYCQKCCNPFDDGALDGWFVNENKSSCGFIESQSKTCQTHRNCTCLSKEWGNSGLAGGWMGALKTLNLSRS